jgi:hypothetical protein
MRREKMKKIVALFLALNFLLGLNLLSVNAQGVKPLEGISMEKAKQIALKQVKGNIVSAHVEKDDGMTKYEFIIQANDGRYEVEIDQSSGKVLEVEKEGSGSQGGDDDGHGDDDD